MKRSQLTSYLEEKCCARSTFNVESDEEPFASGEWWTNTIIGGSALVPHDDNLSAYTCVLILNNLKVTVPSELEDIDAMIKSSPHGDFMIEQSFQ